MFLIILTVFVVFIAVLVLLSPLIAPKRLMIEGAHVLITGGSSGIGKSIAKKIVQRGGKVTLVARNEAKLSEAKCSMLKESGVNEKFIFTKSLDVTSSYENVHAAIEEIECAMGPVDMLVNCAGFAIAGRFEEILISDFKRLMDLNFFGTLYPTRSVIKGMMQRKKGRIVFLSSQAGQLGLFGYTGYSASKFALRGFAEALQMEMKPYDVFITLAFPPDTDTPGLAEENKSKPEETVLISENGGLYTPDFVADKIIDDAVRGKFLCSIGLEGFLLSTLTCGLTPVISILEATMQVVSLGLMRAIGLIVYDNFERLVRRCKDRREQKEKQS